MASWMVHLRVADELLMQIESLDEQAFVMGNIAAVITATFTESINIFGRNRQRIL